MSDAPELPDLNEDKPIYYFAGGFGDGLEPTLEVVKSWPEGQQSLALGTYDTLEDAFEAERELVALKEKDGLQYIEVTLGDIEAANRIAHEVLGRCVDELPPQTRRLLGLIVEMVSRLCHEKHLDRDQCFSRGGWCGSLPVGGIRRSGSIWNDCRTWNTSCLHAARVDLVSNTNFFTMAT
ncbi:MAG: hypothetical protein HC927_14040 [Deltaproteobacteria bacterium]|nr:hypothetical protein [Deltaproteobacteria bacterium]